MRIRYIEPALAAVALATVAICTRCGASPQTAAAAAEASSLGSNAERRTPASSEPTNASTDKRSALEVTHAVVSGDATHPKLSTWSAAVVDLRSGRRSAPLRILWFGDSHAAADFWPSSVRKSLSAVLPAAGPGYLALGVPNYRHGMARLWRAGGLDISPHPPARRSTEDDGVFGLGGTRVTMKDSTALVTMKLTFEGAATAKINYELFYRTTSETDLLALSLGEERREFGPTKESIGGISSLRFDSDGRRTVEIRALRGQPQLFGVVAETETPGFVLDTLGINGARFGTPLAWQKESFSAVLAARHPLVAVVAYGTNEVFDEEAVARHAERQRQFIERLRAAVPDIGCIVAGPTDVGRGGTAAAERVAALDEAERSTAEELGCIYFSPYQLISKEGGFIAWQKSEPPLALSDGIHFTARGYSRLGEAMAQQCFNLRPRAE